MLNDIPGYEAGTYSIDPVHSTVSFSVRHMMVAKVRGEITGVEGTIVLADDPSASTVQATVDPSTIDTRNADRDAHIRSNDFFATDEHPTWNFQSTSARDEGGTLFIDGDLTLRGVTKPVAFELEFGGIGVDAYGQTRAGASAKTVVKRSEFGISFNTNLEKGGVMLGEDVTIELEISAVKQVEASVEA